MNPQGDLSSGHSDVFGPLPFYVGFVVRSAARHRALAAGVLAAGAVLGIVAAWAMPQTYEVRATILAQRTTLMGALSNPGMNRDWDAPTRAAREVVMRRQNLLALCQQTNFVKRYRATRAPAVRIRDWLFGLFRREQRTDERTLEDLVRALEARLWVAVTGEGTVGFGFQWSDPDLAYDIVEAAVQSFIEARNTSEIGAMGDAIAILQAHDVRVQKDIAAAIDRLDQKERGLRLQSAARLPAPRARPRDDEELVRAQTVLASRRQALADLESFRQRRASELQLQLTQQLAIYAPEHPLVATTRHNIDALNAPSPQMVELRAEIAQLEADVTRRGGDSREALGGGAALELEVAAARMRVMEIRDPRLEYERVQLEAALRRHANLVERIEAARIEMETARAGFEQRYSVMSPPQRPRGPLKPYRIIYLLGGVLAGAGFALIASATVDLSGGRVVEPWQVEHRLGLPVLSRPRR